MGIINLVLGALAVACGLYTYYLAPSKKVIIVCSIATICLTLLAAVNYSSSSHGGKPGTSPSGTPASSTAPAKPGAKKPTGKKTVTHRTTRPNPSSTK